MARAILGLSWCHEVELTSTILVCSFVGPTLGWQQLAMAAPLVVTPCKAKQKGEGDGLTPAKSASRVAELVPHRGRVYLDQVGEDSFQLTDMASQLRQSSIAPL